MTKNAKRFLLLLIGLTSLAIIILCITRNMPVDSVQSEIDVEQSENDRVEELTTVKEEKNPTDQNNADESDSADADSNEPDQSTETDTAFLEPDFEQPWQEEFELPEDELN